MTRIADMPHSCLIAATWHPDRVSCRLAWLSTRDSLVAALGRVTRGHQLIVPDAPSSASRRQTYWPRLHEGMQRRASLCDYRDLPVTSSAMVLSMCIMSPWVYQRYRLVRPLRTPHSACCTVLCAMYDVLCAMCYVLCASPHAMHKA